MHLARKQSALAPIRSLSDFHSGWNNPLQHKINSKPNQQILPLSPMTSITSKVYAINLICQEEDCQQIRESPTVAA